MPPIPADAGLVRRKNLPSRLTIDLYRMGHYGGAGARHPALVARDERAAGKGERR